MSTRHRFKRVRCIKSLKFVTKGTVYTVHSETSTSYELINNVNEHGNYSKVFFEDTGITI